jgi:hypothetical protein
LSKTSERDASLRLGFIEEAGAFMNWLEGRFRYAADREYRLEAVGGRGPAGQDTRGRTARAMATQAQRHRARR